jgi:hypothetical protein
MFDLMYFVNSESDFETEHCMCDWLMNNLTDNSVLMNRTAVKSMMSMNEMKQNAVMLLSWLFHYLFNVI